MANYKLGPVIGKIGGGAEVQKIPVEAVADGGSGSRVIMHTVHVPEGETWLVVLSGDLDPSRSSSINGPLLFIGEVSIGPSLPAGQTFITAEVTGTAEISLSQKASGTDRFVGHAYFAPLP